MGAAVHVLCPEAVDAAPWDAVDTAHLGAAGADVVVVLRGSGVAEDVADALAASVRETVPWAVLAPSTAFGREVAGRAAAATHSGLVGDAIALSARRRRAGGGQARVRRRTGGRHHLPQCHADGDRPPGRAGAAAAAAGARSSAVVTRTDRACGDGSGCAADRRDDDVETLARAPVVIGVGTGVAPEEYEELSPLAAVLGAELAATRKVTDKGWAPRARQVGITGRSIAPRLYVALGLSGKFNHMVGVRAAGTILAVNADPGAPVFEHCDVGIVGDWHQVVPLLQEALRRGHRGATARRSVEGRAGGRAHRRHDLVVGGAGPEHGGHAVGHEHVDVGRRDDAADDDGRLEAGGTEGTDDRRRQREMGAVVHGDADDVDILLGRHGGDALGRLAQPGVDDLASGVAQDARHDAQPTVVPIEADLGHEDAQGALRAGHGRHATPGRPPAPRCGGPLRSRCRPARGRAAGGLLAPGARSRAPPRPRRARRGRSRRS